jgi:hypothetical protein
LRRAGRIGGAMFAWARPRRGPRARHAKRERWFLFSSRSRQGRRKARHGVRKCHPIWPSAPARRGLARASYAALFCARLLRGPPRTHVTQFRRRRLHERPPYGEGQGADRKARVTPEKGCLRHARRFDGARSGAMLAVIIRETHEPSPPQQEKAARDRRLRVPAHP